jgi:hypothetical protein
MEEISSEILNKARKERRELLIGLIEELGYRKSLAKKFAQGYISKIDELPEKEKIIALIDRHDVCMSAGFKFAEINEDEAFERYKERYGDLERVAKLYGYSLQ